MTKPAKKPRKKKCKVCKEWFQPKYNFQAFCKPECGFKLAQIKKAEKEERDHRELKKTLKPISHWLKETQKVFNEYIRERDRDLACISCGTLDAPEWCAGHYRSRGAASNLRFNEFNTNRQCNAHCNLHLSGNIAGYRPRLIAKIGLERVEDLENNNETRTWTREELEALRKVYKMKIKQLKNV